MNQDQHETIRRPALLLVDERLREKKQDAIWNAHLKADASDLDVIIALRMFQEGANWRWANREIIIGQRNSLTEVVQTEGRLFRDVAGKSHVETYHLLPFAFDQVDKSAVREDLNDYMKAILLSMLLEDVFAPVPPPEHTGSEGVGRTIRSFLKEAVSDGGELAEIVGEIRDIVGDALAANDSYRDIETFREPYNQIVSTVLSKHGVEIYHREIAEQLLRMFERRTISLAGLNVGHVNIQLIKENPFGCLLQWGSALLGTVTFQELRQATARRRSYTYISFDEALLVARKSGVKDGLTWHTFAAERTDVPLYPDQFYEGKGWISWYHFLGTEFLPFEEASVIVRQAGIKTQMEWRDWTARPTNIPSNPQQVYEGKGWVSFPHFLGTKNRQGQGHRFLSFPDALALARKSGIETSEEWGKWADLPDTLPQKPDHFYKGKGWVSWPHFLGTYRRSYAGKAIPSFSEALVIARNSGIKDSKSWAEWAADNMPRHPDSYYKGKGWIGWAHFLGTEFLPFDQALAIARSSGFTSRSQWHGWKERPDNVPRSPNVVYKGKGWISWPHFLGKDCKLFLPFKRALVMARRSGIKTAKEWMNWRARPTNLLPFNPSNVYRGDGWISWSHFLGTEALRGRGRPVSKMKKQC